MNIKVTRSQTETYKVYIDNRWQATIMIEDSSGLLSIQSEYGHFSHYWGTGGRSAGNTFKQELLRFGLDYVQNKLSYNDDLGHWFNFDETVKRIRQDILEKRRERRIESPDARVLWYEADNLEECKTSSEFAHQLFAKYSLMTELYDGDYLAIPIITETHPRLRKFMEVVYPIFKAELAKEEACLETV
jgi:hypothetical protein